MLGIEFKGLKNMFTMDNPNKKPKYDKEIEDIIRIINDSFQNKEFNPFIER